MTCPACNTRFIASAGPEDHETPCLNCDHPVPFPGRKLASSSAEENSSPEKSSKTRKPDLFAAMAEERFSGEVYQPRLPFLEGTFTFPWYPEGLFRWIVLSAGCSIVMVLFVAMHWCFARGGWFARAGYAFGFPFGWLSIWTFSYAASCGTAILIETAAGNDRITGWPEPDWRDWMSDLLALLPSALTAVSIAFGISALGELIIGQFWGPGGIALFFMLPICLLSTIEAHSAFIPFSPLILKSLVYRASAWGRFYLASGVLAVLWPGSLIVGYQKQPFYAAAVTGPLMAISLLVYPRLLGRLGGCIADLQEQEEG